MATAASLNNQSSGTTSSSTTTLTVSTEDIVTPFSDVNKPFQQAMTEADEKNWCFQKGEIPLATYIDAINGFLNIFDALGSPIVTEIVRKDFRWKTNALRNSSRRLRAESLRDLVRNELKSPPRFWAAQGIESLLWSHRVLQFVESLVDNMVEDTNMELTEACLKAYRSTMAARHPQVTKIIFERALHLVPTKSQFFANMTDQEEATEDDLKLGHRGMKELLRSTRPFIEALTCLFELEEIEDSDR